MIVRSLIISLGLFILLLGSLSTGFYDQAIAQKTSETVSGNNVVKELAAEKVGIDASELLTRIKEAAEDAQRYMNEMKAASEEDRLVIQLQIYLLQQRILDDVHQLSDALLEQEKKGKQPELRRQERRRTGYRLLPAKGGFRSCVSIVQPRRGGTRPGDRVRLNW